MEAGKSGAFKLRSRGGLQGQSGSRNGKGKRSANAITNNQHHSSDDDDFVPRRTKKSKGGRIGRTAGKNYPPEIQRALGRAHMLYVEGNISKASQELSQVVVQCSSIPEPYALLALIYHDSGKYEEALMFYKLACARDPRRWGNHREAARIAGILGDHASRLEALRVLARLQPSNLNVAIDRARCLVELQKPKQALDVYAKAVKRYPRRFDIYLDLAEGVECTSPQQHLFVHQALASCLRRAMGKKHLGPDVKELADGFTERLREIKLEHPIPRRLPPRSPSLPSKRVGEVALTATDLLVTKLMENRKRQEPQFEVAVQAIEGLVGWLDACRALASRADAESDSGEGEASEDDAGPESDSDLRDSNDEGSGDDDEDYHVDGNDSSGKEGGEQLEDEEGDDSPMERFTVYPTTLVRYGICQLHCGEKEKAAQAFSFLDNEEPEGPCGDMMLEVAKVYAETGHTEESLVMLRQVAQSAHHRHVLAAIQLGAAFASQGKHELAAEAYSSVLVERPRHAAALAGFAEAAYWRGADAVASALSALALAIDAGTREWIHEEQADPPCDEDGEHATTFQRVQLLLQWATLSRMAGNVADFASVALPLVNVAICQMDQRQRYDRERSAGLAARAPVDRTASSEQAAQIAPCRERERGEQHVQDGVEDGSSAGTQERVWTPQPVSPLVGQMSWQVGRQEHVHKLALHLLQSTDVIAEVGRRAIFWHLIELVSCLHKLATSSEVMALVSAAAKPNDLLRGLEKEDLQAAAANPDVPVIFITMPGGSPILGPTAREGPTVGNIASADTTVPDEASPRRSSGQFYAPPWRCVEEKDDNGIPRKVGRAWTPSQRPAQPGTRRSRARPTMRLVESSEEGDVICVLVHALSRDPRRDAVWNLLQRVATDCGVDPGDGAFRGEKMEALITRHRELAQGLLYRGHDAAVWNRSKQALKFYRQSHALRPEQPLPMLCLATQIVRMVTVMETMVEHDDICVLQALACLHRYAELRRKLADDNTAGASGSRGTCAPPVPYAVLEQETLYNLGRGYHQVGLAGLAIEYYSRALRIEDEQGHELRNWHGGEGVTKETAMNLCKLYKKTGATSMAAYTLEKYLAVG